MKKYLFIFCFIIFDMQIVEASSTSLANYQPGFYLGLQLGLGSDSDSDADRFMDKVYESISNTTKDLTKKNHVGGRLLLGYSVNPYFSLESGFTIYPSHKIRLSNNTGSLEHEGSARSLDLVGKLILPLERVSTSFEGLSIYGKFGPALGGYKQVKYVLHTNSADSLGYKYFRFNKWGLSYGLGLNYSFTTSFGVDLSWSGLHSFHKSKYSYDSANDIYHLDTGLPSARMFALGVSYKFQL